jgi:hypothetical protein
MLAIILRAEYWWSCYFYYGLLVLHAEAGPTVPVQITGFDQQPEVGDSFAAITREQYRLIKYQILMLILNHKI